MRILLAEDDPMLGSSVKVGLEQDGLTVDWVTNGAAADDVVKCHRYDAVLLDLGLPGIDGEALLRRWRARAELTPIVVLTARGFVLDRVRLLNLGADDYLVKPFDLLELCARIRAVVRRAAGQGSEVLQCGPLQLYRDAQVVVWHGRRVEVTNKEFWLLEALVRNRNRVVTRRQLEDALYGWGEEVESNAIEVHIHHLRRKLARDLILTVRGSGYSLAHDLGSV
jgi:two-component system OmpR family response regulator/two-component system response regulator QseB